MPRTVASWRRARERAIPFLNFPPMLRVFIPHQRDRVIELPAAQGLQQPWQPLWQRGAGQAAVAGDLRHRGKNLGGTTRRAGCPRPDARPRAGPSRDASPPTGHRCSPSSPPPTRTTCPLPICRSTQKSRQAPSMPPASVFVPHLAQVSQGEPADDRSRADVTKDLTRGGPFPSAAVTRARPPRVTAPPAAAGPVPQTPGRQG